jgi:chemotaxis methyl-accepting protein methylase
MSPVFVRHEHLNQLVSEQHLESELDVLVVRDAPIRFAQRLQQFLQRRIGESLALSQRLTLRN